MTYYILSVGSFQGLLMAILLLVAPKASKASTTLGIWCLFLGLNFFGGLIYITQSTEHFWFMLGILEMLPASYGGLIYLYFRYSINGNTDGHSKKWWLHGIPLFVCYLLMTPIFILGKSDKLAHVALMHSNDMGFLTHLPFHILFAQAFVYFFVCVYLLLKSQKQAQGSLSNIPQGLFRWLWVVLAFYILVWALKGVANYIIDIALINHLADTLIVLLLTSVAMAQWRNPSLFALNLPSKKTEQARYGENRLPDSLSQSLHEQVTDFMNKERPYFDNNLNLQLLAQNIGLSTHQLSQIINEREGKNFYQFINQYRIDAVCENIKQQPEKNVLDIAFECGFASKSSFNAVFKKLQQMTPTEYKRQFKNQA